MTVTRATRRRARILARRGSRGRHARECKEGRKIGAGLTWTDATGPAWTATWGTFFLGGSAVLHPGAAAQRGSPLHDPEEATSHRLVRGARRSELTRHGQRLGISRRTPVGQIITGFDVILSGRHAEELDPPE